MASHDQVVIKYPLSVVVRAPPLALAVKVLGCRREYCGLLPAAPSLGACVRSYLKVSSISTLFERILPALTNRATPYAEARGAPACGSHGWPIQCAEESAGLCCLQCLLVVQDSRR